MSHQKLDQKVLTNISAFKKPRLYKIIRYKVVKEIRKSKQDYFYELDGQLSSDDYDPKLLWKTSKQVLNLDKSSNSIQTLKMNNKFAETDQAKAEMWKFYFSSQTGVDNTNKPCYFKRSETLNVGRVYGKSIKACQCKPSTLKLKIQ